MSNPWDDTLRRVVTITSVFRNPDGAYDFCLDNAHNDGLPAGHAVVPKVGDKVTYWRTMESGYTMIGVRGCAINDRIIYYKTLEEYAAEQRAFWLFCVGDGAPPGDDDCRRLAGVMPW